MDKGESEGREGKKLDYKATIFKTFLDSFIFYKLVIFT